MPPKRHPVKPGQQSVWDFPRPAVVEPVTACLQVDCGGQRIAETRAGFRTLETSHPPTYYIPPHDIRPAVLQRAQRRTVCEWKGQAVYFHVEVGHHLVRNAAWSYPQPTAAFDCMKDCVAFYPGLMDACFVDGERVVPQPGGFYGGWITSAVVGPFKGEPGTGHW